SKQHAAYAADLLPMYVTASAYEGSLFERRLEKEPRYFVELDAYFRSLPKEQFPAFSDIAVEMTANDDTHDARFEFGLDVLMHGLAALAKPPKAAPKPKPTARKRT